MKVNYLFGDYIFLVRLLYCLKFEYYLCLLKIIFLKVVDCCYSLCDFEGFVRCKLNK